MRRDNGLSRVTARYLARSREILEEMKDGMSGGTPCGSIAQDVIVRLIPQQRAAIAMSENLLRYTTWLPLERIAASIADACAENAAGMERVLAQCSQPENTSAQEEQYSESRARILAAMFRDMTDIRAVNSVNAEYIRCMLPLLRGTIRMAENAQRFPLCEELRTILEKLIREESGRVRAMQRLYRNAAY